MIIDPRASSSLELDKIVSAIRRDCRCDLGALALSRAVPAADMSELEERRSLFSAIEMYRDARGDLAWSWKLSAVSPSLDEARERGMMTGKELVAVRRLMDGAVRVKEDLRAAREEWPALGAMLRRIRDFESDVAALACFEEDGRLVDSASDKLRRTRESMRSTRDAIRRKGSAILSDPSLAGMLQERVLSIRNGRHAVLVRQDSVFNFPGMVMDRSSSGNSVYMEPHALARLNNEHALLEDDERTEERRLLHKHTERVLSREQAIREAEQVLGEIDMYYALSEKIRRDEWTMPRLTRAAEIDIRRARHPLLGDAAVPVDIRCGAEWRALVVTGPNTGGKTVALKTAGVCTALAWYGWPIPASEDSLIGSIGEIFSDIGDEQSIEQNLSTFSAHIAQIDRILRAAGPSSLVLLDELGAGTDPEEGAALGIAILDRLREIGSLVLATTHHNPIKRYALSTEGVESASAEFDLATLSPTYRLLIGIPGRSNAILIAERLGMDPAVLARARGALRDREVSMEDIIAELHEKRAEIELENVRLDQEKRRIERARADHQRELEELEARRDKMIAEADRKAVGIVKNAEQSAKSLMRTIEAEARGAASRKYQRSKKHFETIKESAESREDARTARTAPEAGELAVGDMVVVIGTNTPAVIESLSGDHATLTAGSATIELPTAMLRRPTTDESKSEKKALRAGRRSDIKLNLLSDDDRRVRINMPKAPTGVPSSIMVRGMTIDEALPMAESFLDRAYRAGYGEVTIIHGRGEGILRREVHMLCNRLPYVTTYRLGGPGEGGHGVTVIRFK